MPSEQYITINGHRVWTASDGAGRHIVLCHGGPGCWDDLGDVARMLSGIATVHRYDQRACGRSAGPSPTTMQELVDDLEALRIAWKVERWIVGGHSAGAALALLYAATFPARTDAVVYISGTGLDWARWRDAYHAAADARLTAEQRAEREQLQALLAVQPGDRKLHDRYCLLQWSTDFADRSRALGLASRLLEPGLLVNWDANRNVNADWDAIRRDPARRKQLESITLPILVLHGEGDPRPVAAVDALSHVLPNARLEVIPRAGHYPWMENAAATRDLICSFVASLT
jgi:proline iminopeptidase